MSFNRMDLDPSDYTICTPADAALLAHLRSPATQEALRTIYNRWTIYAKNPKYSQASREKWLLRAAALNRLLVEPVEEE